MTQSEPETGASVSLEQIGWLAGWFTLAVLAAILFVALYPFDFSARRIAIEHARPILFWLRPVAKRWLGWTVNMIFFMPFGFSLAWWLRTRNWRVSRRGLAVLLLGVVLSLSIEYLQLFIPHRNGSWDDVAMNTLGGVVGWLVFEWLGVPVLRLVGDVLVEFTAILER